MNTGHKEAARDESRGGFLGVSNCGGDHLIAVSAQRACCGGDDEVIDGVCRDAIRLDNADESAGAVAVHCVSSRLRAGWRKPVPGDPHPGGLPSYQLACVVDDATMGVTEVVRGADLLKSAARQILLQRALGLPAVDYFHTALLRDEHGVRLAKRHDAL